MINLGEFEIQFLKSVEKSLSLVPSQLDSTTEDLWRSTLLSLGNHLSDIALIINCHYNESV